MLTLLGGFSPRFRVDNLEKLRNVHEHRSIRARSKSRKQNFDFEKKKGGD